MKRNLVIATIAAATLIGGGTYTAVAVDGDNSTPGPVTQLPPPHGSSRPQIMSWPPLSAEQAADAAVKEVPGTVASIEHNRRGAHWEIDVLDKDGRTHELTVGPDGTVRPDDGSGYRVALEHATVDARQAADAALAAVPGAVTSVEIDGDRAGYWEVDVLAGDGRTHELNVQARTGEVLPDPADEGQDD